MITAPEIAVTLASAAALVGAMAAGLVNVLVAALAPVVGERGVLGGLAVAALLPAALCIVLRFARGRRRFARCLVSAERVRFVEDDQLARTIEREELRGWVRTPHGLLLDVSPWPPGWLWPYLIPTADAAELTLAEALLRGEDPVAAGLTSAARVEAGRDLLARLSGSGDP